MALAKTRTVLTAPSKDLRYAIPALLATSSTMVDASIALLTLMNSPARLAMIKTRASSARRV